MSASYVDLKKAFDNVVDHHLLWNKLQHIGISDTKL